MIEGSSTQRVSGVRNNQERPVLYQKHFKSGSRTYATQIKVATNGKRYLVLAENVRDDATQEIKKHQIHVFDRDLKEYFAMLQETVLFLRSQKDLSNSTAPGLPSKPAVEAIPARRPAAAPRAVTTKPVVTSTKLTVKSAQANKVTATRDGKNGGNGNAGYRRSASR